VVDNLDLSINAGILRYVHFMKLGDYIIDPQIILPFGSQKIGLSDSKTSGIGDLIFGGTLWTIADLAAASIWAGRCSSPPPPAGTRTRASPSATTAGPPTFRWATSAS
jgi:hypothetical protein